MVGFFIDKKKQEEEEEKRCFEAKEKSVSHKAKNIRGKKKKETSTHCLGVV